MPKFNFRGRRRSSERPMPKCNNLRLKKYIERVRVMAGERERDSGNKREREIKTEREREEKRERELESRNIY